jgi:hypothetical protein
MNTVLILTAKDGAPSALRAGDLFDQALIEIIRVLDIAAERASILVPWSMDLAPLIAVGTADTAPSFDPEGDGRIPSSRSGLVPYLPPGVEWSEQDEPLFRSSHLSLEQRDRPMPFDTAIGQYPPTWVVVLACTDEFSPFRAALRESSASFVTFGSLMPPERIATEFGIPIEQVTDLEQRLPSFVEKSDIPDGSEFADEIGRDAGLEPFVPFGLLIQDYFADLLPDDEPRPSPERR